jgi:hypothetical protein
MKSQPPSNPPEPSKPLPLLREAIEVLIGELTVLSEHKTENLPELKKKKVVLAHRLGKVDWEHSTEGREACDVTKLRSLIFDLETQSHQQIQDHLELIANQVLALEEERQYWRECMNVSLRKFCESVSSTERA